MSKGTYEDLAKTAKARLRHMKKRKRAEDDLDLVCDLMGRGKLVSNTTTTDLEGLVLALEKRKGIRGKPLSGASINRYLASLSGAFKWAAERPERGFGSLPLIVWPWQPEKPPAKPVITIDDQDRLIDHFRDRPMAVVLQVLFETGMRVGELVKLQRQDLWGDVWIRLVDTKNGDTRDVDVSHDLWMALGRLIDSKRLPPYHVIRDAFLGARKALGLDPRVVIHCIRHTAATRLAEAQVPDTNAMRLLGHRAVQTYQRYAHKSHSATQATTKVLRSNRHDINTTPENHEQSQVLGGPGGTRTHTGAILSRLSPRR